MFATHPIPAAYRAPLVGAPDPRFRRALAIASGLGVVFLLVVLVTPRPEPATKTVEELPERFAKLILDEPKPPAPVVKPGPKAEVEAPKVEARTEEPPKPEATPAPRERRTPREEAPKVATDRGTTGRAKARTEVTEQLSAVTSGVDETLETLAAVLPAAQASEGESSAAPRRRGGRVRAGRGSSATGTATARTIERGGGAGSGSVDAREVDLGSFGEFDLSGVTGEAMTPGGGGGPAGDVGGDRSASDLMGVVRRYAPGIRFCYDGALESDPSLRGKVVFRITVAPDGSVTEVDVAEDTLGDAGVLSCALTQIRAWRFGRAAGASVFDAPFVFRPQG